VTTEVKKPLFTSAFFCEPAKQSIKVIFICFSYYVIMVVEKGGKMMSPGLVKMWIALASIAFMFISVFSIYFSRYKAKNKLVKFIFAFFAYVLMILAGIIIIFVVFSGPVQE
jgi:hypothetical protein